MIEPLTHENAMGLAVQLACSYLGTSHSGSTDAEELILSYYRQIRNVEARLADPYTAAEPKETATDLLIAVAA